MQLKAHCDHRISYGLETEEIEENGENEENEENEGKGKTGKPIIMNYYNKSVGIIPSQQHRVYSICFGVPIVA